MEEALRFVKVKETTKPDLWRSKNLQQRKYRSLKINMVLNAIKGALSIIFPLISFPYVSRTLGVNNLGKYNFSFSIIDYIVLLSGLGINTYAIREGAKLRENQKKINKFSSEMLSYNLLSTAVAYLLLGILLLIVPKFYSYRIYILILGIQVIFRTIGVEWLYSIYEDYLFITIRSIVFQMLSLVLLFVFVHDENDLWVYCVVTVFSNAGANLLNLIYSRRYVTFRLTTKIDFKKHTKPIMVLFATQLMTTIFVSSDTTILGFLCGDRSVGLYSVSTKIYTVMKTILSSAIVVSIPRLSAVLGDDRKDTFSSIAQDVYSTLLTFMVPIIFGIIVLRKELVLILSGKEYLESQTSLLILGFSLFFSMSAWFWGQSILVTNEKENVVFKSATISAVINVVLNFILIPFWQQNAAALTTLIAEAISFYIQWKEGRKIVKFKNFYQISAKVFVGCLPIILWNIAVKKIVENVILQTILIFACSVVSYFLIEIILKNECIYSIRRIARKDK